MDTGSELIWVQCEDCLKPPNKCFGNPPQYFTNAKSYSYHPIPCSTRELCYQGKCIGEFCSYEKHYVDESSSYGILAFERFIFGTDSRLNDITEDIVFNLVFGCNIYSDGQSSDRRDIGIVGLGWGPRSLISQIKTHIHDCFSYCIPHYDNTALGSQGYLQLGLDGDHQGEDFSSTGLRRFGDFQNYFLNLEAISVNRIKLPLLSTIFKRKNDKGGTIIDSGSSFTLLAPIAYRELKKALITYFKSMGNYERIKSSEEELNFDLCYKSSRLVAEELPSITFHFLGSNLELKSENVFIWLDNPQNGFCLAIHPNDDEWTIIGAYQRSNFRFIYDRRRMLLLFRPEECHRNA